MERDTRYMHEIAESYKQDLITLLPYIPWLKGKQGARLTTMFGEQGIAEHSMSFPVYDSNLMGFVRVAANLTFIDKNYIYVYTRRRIKNVADEQRIIELADIKEMDVLIGILSKYIVGGRTNARIWPMGVENGIILKAILKMKEILDFWGVKIDEEDYKNE